MPRQAGRFARVVAEFAVICAGVLAALVADDWREGREQRDLADRALYVMLSDLAADSAVLEVLATAYAADDHAAARLLAHIDDPAFPQDSAEAYLHSFYQGAPYAPSRAGYSSAVQTGALQHIGDDGLRVALVSYFEQSSTMFSTWFTEIVEWDLSLLNRLNPHFRPEIGSQAASLFPIPWKARRLRSSWNALRQDDGLMHQLFDFGSYAGEFANDTRERLRQNLVLQSQIRAELGVAR